LPYGKFKRLLIKKTIAQKKTRQIGLAGQNNLVVLLGRSAWQRNTAFGTQ